MEKLFPLEMADGTVARTLADIREHFDKETLLNYFENDILIRWLKARFYDEEVEALKKISPDDEDYPQNLWQILGIPKTFWMEGPEFQRLLEKENYLREKTDDESIIDFAEHTALDQSDLAELLNKGINKIYLCGDEFRIPLVDNINYEGILSTPNIITKLTDEEEANNHGIHFTNAVLPWGKVNNSNSEKQENDSNSDLWLIPKAQMMTMFKAAFKDDLENKIGEYSDELSFMKADKTSVVTKWTGELSFMKADKTSAITKWTEDEKKFALLILCENKYDEHDVIHLRMTHDMTSGIALTRDSFCILDDKGESVIVPYEDFSPIAFKALPNSVIKTDKRKQILQSFMDMCSRSIFGLYFAKDLDKYLQNMNTAFRKLKPCSSSSGSDGYGLDAIKKQKNKNKTGGIFGHYSFNEI